MLRFEGGHGLIEGRHLHLEVLGPQSGGDGWLSGVPWSCSSCDAKWVLVAIAAFRHFWRASFWMVRLLILPLYDGDWGMVFSMEADWASWWVRDQFSSCKQESSLAWPLLARSKACWWSATMRAASLWIKAVICLAWHAATLAWVMDKCEGSSLGFALVWSPLRSWWDQNLLPWGWRDYSGDPRYSVGRGGLFPQGWLSWPPCQCCHRFWGLVPVPDYWAGTGAGW